MMLGAAPRHGDGSPAARTSSQYSRVEYSLEYSGAGVEEYGRTEGLVHTRTPGCQDVITFDEQASGAGESRGIAHFGFRLVSPGDIDAAVDEVEHAGGKLLRRGEFSPGYPYAYVADPGWL